MNEKLQHDNELTNEYLIPFRRKETMEKKYLYRINEENDEIEKLEIVAMDGEVSLCYYGTKTIYALRDSNGEEFEIITELGSEEAIKVDKIFPNFMDALKEFVFIYFGVNLKGDK